MIYFAHRGLSDYAPENTQIAFDMAVKQGAKAIELDVQRTADGKIVVMHDFYLGRTNSGKGLLKDYRYEELKKLDMGSWFSPQFAGERMPLLEEVLQVLPKDIYVNIEMKKLAMEEKNDFAQKVVEIIDKYPREVLVSSFDHNLLKEVQEQNDKIPLGLLYASNLRNLFQYIESNQLKIQAIHPSIEYVSPLLIQQAHDRGIHVNVYTIRQKVEAELLKTWKVDGIFVNRFDL